MQRLIDNVIMNVIIQLRKSDLRRKGLTVVFMADEGDDISYLISNTSADEAWGPPRNSSGKHRTLSSRAFCEKAK